MRRVAVFSIASLVLLAAAGAASWAPMEIKEVPPTRSIEFLPTAIQGWSATNRVPSDILPVDPRAPSQLLRTFQNGSQIVWAAISYYPAQTEARRPAARDLLFPGQGWAHLSEQRVVIRLDGESGGSIPANLVVMDAGGRRIATLYWYQVQEWRIANDHWYRAVLVYNRLVRRRTDGAFIRMATPVLSSTPSDTALRTLTLFLQAYYPELLRTLPR